jgi:selenocysteine lyase/cysteine desulfurase
MKITRRDSLIGAGTLALASLTQPLAKGAATAEVDVAEPFDPATALPHKAAFFPLRGTYLNSGSQHPLSRGARASVDEYLQYKTMSGDQEYSADAMRTRVVEKFAHLINASVDEICFVQSTTAGENLVINALDIPDIGGRIVTDALHFFGSIPTYAELAKRGMDVVTLRPRQGRIDMAKLEAAVTAETVLVALSSVSTFNGFEHDLKRVCEIAHNKGALVYADVIHSVGAVPFDVRATGVDFCSTASYKWLMADMGLGFLYVRADRLERLQRPWYGYHQVTRFQSHINPGDPPGETVADYELGDNARGYFSMGTVANATAAQLDYSLQYLLDVGVERIQRYRQPMIDLLQEALPPRGYEPLTPRESRTPLVTFACMDARNRILPKLREAGITISVSRNHFRVSPSVFNDMDDIDHLIEVLS